MSDASDTVDKKERARQRRIQTGRELEERGFIDHAVKEYVRAQAPEEAARVLAANGRPRDAGQAILDCLKVRPSEVGRLDGAGRALAIRAATLFDQGGEPALAQSIRATLAATPAPSVPSPTLAPPNVPSPTVASPGVASTLLASQSNAPRAAAAARPLSSSPAPARGAAAPELEASPAAPRPSDPAGPNRPSEPLLGSSRPPVGGPVSFRPPSGGTSPSFRPPSAGTSASFRSPSAGTSASFRPPSGAVVPSIRPPSGAPISPPAAEPRGATRPPSPSPAPPSRPAPTPADGGSPASVGHPSGERAAVGARTVPSERPSGSASAPSTKVARPEPTRSAPIAPPLESPPPDRLSASGEVVTDYAGSRHSGWRDANDASVDRSIEEHLAAGRKGAAARIARDVGRFEQALAWFRELELHMQAGACLRALGRNDEALAELLAEDPTGPNHRKACFELVPLAVELARIDFDIDRFLTRFIEEGPKDRDEIVTYVDLAKLYVRAGLPRGARRCVAKILSYDPHHMEAKALRTELEQKSAPAARPISSAPATARGLPALPTLEEFVRLAREHAPG